MAVSREHRTLSDKARKVTKYGGRAGKQSGEGVADDSPFSPTLSASSSCRADMSRLVQRRTGPGKKLRMTTQSAWSFNLVGGVESFVWRSDGDDMEI